MKARKRAQPRLNIENERCQGPKCEHYSNAGEYAVCNGSNDTTYTEEGGECMAKFKKKVWRKRK